MRIAPLLAVPLLALSCKQKPMDRVEEIRDQLGGDSPRWNAALVRCDGSRPCAPEIAKSIGGAFDDKKPDQISAAAVAVVVAREQRGSDVPSPDVWLASMHKATGPGADALRLATALAMARVADKHARPLDTDADARAFLADVAHAIPGACKTYASLGAGADPDAMPLVESPDHSPCVQRDLSRPTGPGGTYGQGLFRGAAGALALWKAALAALHDGAGVTRGDARVALDRRLATLDAATPKIVPKIVAAPAGNTWNQDEHSSKLGPK